MSLSSVTRINFIDLFGVPGGLSLGFKMAGMNPVGTLDNFHDGLDTFSFNFPEVDEKNIVEADASKPYALELFRKETGLKKGEVDVIAGGPPCQGFSVTGRIKIASLVKNGERSGRSKDPRFIDDHRNYLYKMFVKFVKHYRPKIFVMENVPGMISYKNGSVMEQIMEDFKKIGYKKIRWMKLNAADYGAPQNRKRIFFVGSINEKFNFSWPVKTHSKKITNSAKKSRMRKHVSVRQAIGDLPRIGIPNKNLREKDNPISYGKPVTDFQIWARKKSNGIINNHVTRWHRPIDLKIFSVMKQGGYWEDIPISLRKKIGYSNKSFLDKWKRLSYDKPSWTVVAHLHKDGYMFIHPTQKRTISVREAARLQSFPDHFVFSGFKTSQFKQVGNAVPPLLAKAVGKEIKKAILSA